MMAPYINRTGARLSANFHNPVLGWIFSLLTFFSASFSPPDRPRKFIIILTGLLLFSSLAVTPSIPEEQASASQVKAAFLFNFAKFISWPKGAFADGSGVIIFCILAQEPMAGAVESLQGKLVQGHRIVVKRCFKVEEMLKCQVFFASGADKTKIAQTISVLRNYPILTVTDELNDFAQIGAIINLTLVDDKIRFGIAAHNAEKCGLKISSQLLKLAFRLNN